ncbi:hypothetical protein [Streptomyces incanus]|uniref:Uncharacterized protein n=1 Tax=Streptomyces incanus TaxID=887453 RepID=A0ABW0XX50_9ACTN
MAIKAEIERRWGTIDLLDILKQADFGTDFIAEFTSVATRENLSKDVLRRRTMPASGQQSAVCGRPSCWRNPTMPGCGPSPNSPSRGSCGPV